ncbi:MAG: TonB-dependent receptor [Tannerella sp.]|nr:TonB-dependent receptor [Tannerella sp.]
MKKILFCSLILMLFSVAAFAQQTLKGTVTTVDKQPLTGVSVSVKGSATGTISDIDGNFSLNVKPEDVLVIRYLGFTTQELTVGNQSSVEIVMEENVALLDEVVVVGYGALRKSDITGSVSSVKPSELQKNSLTRTDEALQGQIAGVQVINNDASPNAGISIRIRGVNSITAVSEPLVIIDGMQGGSLSDVHPNDIESLEVLKDASATAIYGARGAGGVILVTTKKGSGTKSSVTYNGFFGFQQIQKKMDLMNAEEYAGYINQNRLARGLAAIFTGQDGALHSPEYYRDKSTDWQDEIYRAGYTQNHHLTVSGKSDNISYSIAGDYLDTKGIVINSQYQKFSLRSNLAINLHKKIRLNLNTFFASANDRPTTLDARDQYGSPVYAALNFAPTRPVFEEDGTYSKPGGGYGSNTEYNPVALALEPVNVNRLNTTIINPELEFQILENLKFQTSASYHFVDGEYDWYYNEKIIGGSSPDDKSTRTASVSDDRWMHFQNTNLLTFEDVFAEKHRLSVTAVLEQQYSKSTSNYAAASGFFTNEKQYKNLGLGENALKPSSYESQQTLLSYMGRLNYTYSGRYSLALTLRSDGASVFAENNKWGYFPSAGAAWNISNEKFMENLTWLNNLKLRLSYGAVGNQAISPYQSLDLLVTGSRPSYSFDGGKTLNPGVALSTIAGNPNLKWEVTRQLNTGIDLSLYKGRLNLTVDAYRKITTDLLLEKQLFLASGQATQMVNAGKIQNRGVEVVLGGIPVQKKSMEWNTNLTFSLNRSRVLALNDGLTEMNLGSPGMPGFNDAIRLEVDYPIGLVKGFRYEGVWKNDERILAGAYGVEPGSSKYSDIDNNGIIDSRDMVTIAQTLPDFTYGWSNNFRFGNVTLNVLMVGVQGNDIVNLGRFMLEGNSDGLSRNLLNAWTPENENTNVPGHDVLGNQRNSSRWVEDGSYLRVKNITLGYNFSSALLKKMKLGSLRVYLTGTNLLTFTRYTGYDPEANNASGIAWGDTAPFAGFDMGSYPSQRRYTVGLDITF